MIQWQQGTVKTITVVYSICGADAANYIKPVNYVATTGANCSFGKSDQREKDTLADGCYIGIVKNLYGKNKIVNGVE